MILAESAPGPQAWRQNVADETLLSAALRRRLDEPGRMDVLGTTSGSPAQVPHRPGAAGPRCASASPPCSGDRRQAAAWNYAECLGEAGAGVNLDCSATVPRWKALQGWRAAQHGWAIQQDAEIWPARYAALSHYRHGEELVESVARCASGHRPIGH